MEPIFFPEHTAVFGAEQPEYRPLPAHVKDDIVTSCWQLEPEELAEVQRTGKIWVSQMTFGAPLQPVLPSAFAPFNWL